MCEGQYFTFFRSWRWRTLRRWFRSVLHHVGYRSWKHREKSREKNRRLHYFFFTRAIEPAREVFVVRYFLCFPCIFFLHIFLKMRCAHLHAQTSHAAKQGACKKHHTRPKHPEKNLARLPLDIPRGGVTRSFASQSLSRRTQDVHPKKGRKNYGKRCGALNVQTRLVMLCCCFCCCNAMPFFLAGWILVSFFSWSAVHGFIHSIVSFASFTPFSFIQTSFQFHFQFQFQQLGP